MKSYISILVLIVFGFAVLGCTNKKKEKETEVLPVEADNGIGDGAPRLDSLLTDPVDTLKQD